MPLTMPSLLKIGELEAQSGVPIRTLRYYEELNLIQSRRRTTGGFRLFAPEVVSRLAFIKRAQYLGFSLQEIGHILTIHDQGELPCAEVRQKLQVKVMEIENRIAELRVLQQQLQGLIFDSEPLPHPQEGVICPILETPL
ncbi:MerR family DNA-binding protein [Synechococcales cyanobacterium C]|uniref:MerR family DNA-binding protein n=1 Tax=Petrachloros mirabilis ULC683 TaxID=2781853 RepID=A0A8K1ZZ59_9CYAN|nr:heavy metal-responsive transcriptional regulator [Petrachloros mirabilis]NCJ07503.1 MerR family DNA-binding protein [Petrachloros mirabilis ULC683]